MSVGPPLWCARLSSLGASTENARFDVLIYLFLQWKKKKKLQKKVKIYLFLHWKKKKKLQKKVRQKKSKREPMKVLWQSMPATGRLDLGPPSGVLVSVP